MENENDNNNNEYFNEYNETVFELEYANQPIKNNIKYKNWEKKIKDKNGNNIRFLRCRKDNIIFCVNKNEKTDDPCTAKCPLCKHLICFYCSRYSLFEMFVGNCCLKRGIYYLFFVNPFESYLKSGSPEIPDSKLISIFFIPYAYLPFSIKLCYLFFFEGLPNITSDDEGNGELVSYGEYYHENKKIAYYIITYIHTLFAFVISIPFTLIDFVFHLLLILISIPFSGTPKLYYFGIIFGSAHPDFYIEDLIFKIYYFNNEKDYYDLPMK